VIYITFDDSCINFCSTWHGGPLADLCDGLRPVCVGFNVRKKKTYHGYSRHVIRPCAMITGSSPIG